MNESDTEGIVRRDELSAESDAAWGRSDPRWAPFCRWSWCRVEPVLVLTMFSVALHNPLSTQYLWARISEDLGYNHTKTSECGQADQHPLQKVHRFIVDG